jgi:hypothetical protein
MAKTHVSRDCRTAATKGIGSSPAVNGEAHDGYQIVIACSISVTL